MKELGNELEISILIPDVQQATALARTRFSDVPYP
jgi:hypothetical protein